MSKDYL